MWLVLFLCTCNSTDKGWCSKTDITGEARSYLAFYYRTPGQGKLSLVTPVLKRATECEVDYNNKLMVKSNGPIVYR